MTVEQLRKLIEGVAGNTPVVIPSADHSYRNSSGHLGTALWHGTAGWAEDHGEDVTPEEDYGVRLPVLIID